MSVGELRHLERNERRVIVSDKEGWNAGKRTRISEEATKLIVFLVSTLS